MMRTIRWVWASVLISAGIGCGGAYPAASGPCTLGLVTADGAGHLAYATLSAHDCEEPGPGPDGTTCWDPYALRAPDAGGDLGTYRCCSGKGVDVDQANEICTTISGD